MVTLYPFGFVGGTDPFRELRRLHVRRRHAVGSRHLLETREVIGHGHGHHCE